MRKMKSILVVLAFLFGASPAHAQRFFACVYDLTKENSERLTNGNIMIKPEKYYGFAEINNSADEAGNDVRRDCIKRNMHASPNLSSDAKLKIRYEVGIACTKALYTPSRPIREVCFQRDFKEFTELKREADRR